jgi:hypothetical protein
MKKTKETRDHAAIILDLEDAVGEAGHQRHTIREDLAGRLNERLACEKWKRLPKRSPCRKEEAHPRRVAHRGVVREAPATLVLRKEDRRQDGGAAVGRRDVGARKQPLRRPTGADFWVVARDRPKLAVTSTDRGGLLGGREKFVDAHFRDQGVRTGDSGGPAGPPEKFVDAHFRDQGVRTGAGPPEKIVDAHFRDQEVRTGAGPPEKPPKVCENPAPASHRPCAVLWSVKHIGGGEPKSARI